MVTEMTILVVEDDKGLNRLIQKTLKNAGLKTKGVFNGNDAIAMASHDQDIIMLLDYKLPDRTGKDVIETLHRQDCFVPFIIVTGHGEDSRGNDENGRKGLYCQKRRIKRYITAYPDTGNQ